MNANEMSHEPAEYELDRWTHWLRFSASLPGVILDAPYKCYVAWISSEESGNEI